MARPVQDRAEAILDAARAQFRVDGGERTTVDAVAARAGVGKGTVFLYWPTKARLWEAVLLLESAQLMADLADDLRTGATHLSVGQVVRRELSAVLDNPDLAPQVLGLPGAMNFAEEFPGRALRRVVDVMQEHHLIHDLAPDEIVSGFGAVMNGAVTLGFDDPGRKGSLLDAAERLIGSTYDRADADPADVAAALPRVLDTLEDTIDQLVASAAPDRPTTAALRPRPRP